ncbi:MAG: hypothetical protein IPK84_02350 [Candidatus Moraniibacteriota bacterium]|nr:MAG: hypothetical protein IPK84_02350 [Candidatus Moranbacteria bacterium]
MGYSQRRATRFRRVRLALRMHIGVTVGILVFYAFLGFLWGPRFSFADFQKTWSVFADDVTVSAVVPEPPVSPVVTVDAACLSDVLSVSLDWADDSGSTSFDIYRDSLLLVSGLTSSSYIDTNLSPGTEYSYVVVAYGPMGAGVASSDPVSVLTPSDCLSSLSPTLTIVTVAGTNVSSLSSVSISDATPMLTGTSNMPNASVSVSIVGATSVYVTFLTNSNGYWEWTPSTSLSSGDYTLTVTVTHPLYSLQTASDSLMLSVSVSSGSDDDDGEHRKKKKKKTPAVSVASPIYRVPPALPIFQPIPAEGLSGTILGAPLSMSLGVVNAGGWVFQSRTLETLLSINRLDRSLENQSGDISYTVYDVSHEKVFESTRTIAMRRGGEYRETIPIPREWASGDYSVVARLHVHDMNIEAEMSFRVIELPLFDFGGGIVVTRDDTLRFLGWASLGSVLSLLLVLLLFVREYWRYAHATKQVNEESFFRFLTARKGKGVDRP